MIHVSIEVKDGVRVRFFDLESGERPRLEVTCGDPSYCAVFENVPFQHLDGLCRCFRALADCLESGPGS